jgi:16S rRNA (guanine527-N7)-methyltransferase
VSGRARALDELAARFALPAPAVGQLRTLLDLLERDPDAPTTVTAWAKALDVHVADSLVALDVPQVREAKALADLGSGAGFPGMALAVALPDARVSLVESSRRTCAFLGRAVAESGLGNATVVNARVEEWAEGRESCDVVTARALAALPVVAEYAAPLLRPGGSLVVWRGRRDPREEQDAAAAAKVLGLEPDGVLAVRPYPQSRNRHLHVFRKSGRTPERFPRRAGMARKHPLHARSEDLA